MRKFYPYLRNAHLINTNQEKSNQNFLSQLDTFVIQKQYIKITLLDWNEKPIKSIEGEIASGSLSKNGNSSIRRAGNISCTVGGGDYSVENANADFAINKKLFIEIGVRNDTDDFPEYPILWFPQGVFLLSSLGVSSSTSGGVVLNLELKDKMSLLSGDVAGVFPSTVIFDEMDTQQPSGEYVTKKVLVHDIIQELVHHYGGEDLNNIVIEDIPLRIRRVMRWTGANPLYMLKEYSTSAGGSGSELNDVFSYTFSLTEPIASETGSVTVFNKDDDVGYVWDDFIYTDELVAAPGSTITSVLDSIKNYIGNCEYFYDEYGIFHFREIKNYLNTTQGKILLDEMTENQYLVEVNNEKSAFTFSDDKNITAITVNPNYKNIKNDFIVLGLKGSDSEVDSSLIYHLAIDTKPELIKGKDKSYYAVYGLDAEDDKPVLILYEEEDTSFQKMAVPQYVSELPEVGNLNLVYSVLEEEEYSFYYYDGSVYQKIDCLAIYDKNNPYYAYDWRTKLYIDGVLRVNTGTEPGYYYAELAAYWPQVYDLLNGCFWDEGVYNENGELQLSTSEQTNAYRTLVNGVYYLDFINPAGSSLGEFCVDNIGRRTKVTQNDDINCLFQPEIPNVVFININDIESEEELINQRNECILANMPYTQVKDDIYANLATGGYHNGAFDQIKYDLYLNTTYQKTISMTCIPAYYLEPNTRSTINESSTNTRGDYMITTINFTLGPGANMSVSCSEVSERF